MQSRSANCPPIHHPLSPPLWCSWMDVQYSWFIRCASFSLTVHPIYLITYYWIPATHTCNFQCVWEVLCYAGWRRYKTWIQLLLVLPHLWAFNYYTLLLQHHLLLLPVSYPLTHPSKRISPTDHFNFTHLHRYFFFFIFLFYKTRLHLLSFWYDIPLCL